MEKKLEILARLNGFNLNDNQLHEISEMARGFSDNHQVVEGDFHDLDFFIEFTMQLIKLNIDIPDSAVSKILAMSIPSSIDDSLKKDECISLTHMLLSECLKNNNIKAFSKISNISSLYLSVSLFDLIHEIVNHNMSLSDVEILSLWRKIPNNILGFILSSIGLTNGYVLCSIYEDAIVSGNKTSSKYLEITSEEDLQKIFIEILSFGEVKIAFELMIACSNLDIKIISEEALVLISTLPEIDIYSVFLKELINKDLK